MLPGGSPERFRFSIQPVPEGILILSNEIVDGSKATTRTESWAKFPTVYELEHRIVRPDGTVRWVKDRTYPFLNPDGKLLRYIGTTLDITERKKAEEALELSRHDLDRAQEVGKIG